MAEDLIPLALAISPSGLASLSSNSRRVREGLADAEAGRVVADQDLDEMVEREFGKRKR